MLCFSVDVNTATPPVSAMHGTSGPNQTMGFFDNQSQQFSGGNNPNLQGKLGGEPQMDIWIDG